MPLTLRYTFSPLPRFRDAAAAVVLPYARRRYAALLLPLLMPPLMLFAYALLRRCQRLLLCHMADERRERRLMPMRR